MKDQKDRKNASVLRSYILDLEGLRSRFLLTGVMIFRRKLSDANLNVLVLCAQFAFDVSSKWRAKWLMEADVLQGEGYDSCCYADFLKSVKSLC